MKILNTLKQTATNLQKKLSTPPPLSPITPQIYHISYPTPQTFQKLLQCLSPQPQQILLYNLSQYPYEKQLIRFLEEKGIEIVQITYQYYTSIPISISLQEVNKICAFVGKGEKNYVLVHCQENMARSVGFLAGFLCFGGIVQDVVVGLAYVNQKLGINSNQTIYSSQHASLRNIANYHKDPTLINPYCLKLSKIILNQAPKHPQITLQPDQPLQIQLQIRKNAVVVYKKLSKQFGQGQIAHFNFFNKDKQKDNSEDYPNQNIVLSDDCLFSFKYVYNGKIYPVLRVQVNTNFVFGAFSRVPMQECDIVKGAVVKGQLFVDFLFTVVADQQSQLSKLAGHQGVSAPNTKKSKQKKQQAKSPQPKKAQPKKQASKSVSVSSTSSTSPDPTPPNKTVQQKNIFKIQQEQKDKDEFDEKLEEQKLNRLIQQLVTKKAKTEEQDLKFAEEEQEEERKKQKQLAQQIQIQQLNQLKQSQEIAKSQPILQLENKVQGNKVIDNDSGIKVQARQNKKEEPVAIKQQSVTTQIEKPSDTVEGEEEDIDIDDYLQNLEKQAQTN